MDTQAQVVARQGRSPGRPSLFTPDRINKLLTLLRQGNYYEPACKAVGINYATFRDWFTAGSNGDPKYSQFYEDVIQAEAEAETNTLAMWSDHMPKDYKAARDFLARRHPSRWAEQRTLKVEGQTTTTHVLQLATTDAQSFLQAYLAMQPDQAQLPQGTVIDTEDVSGAAPE